MRGPSRSRSRRPALQDKTPSRNTPQSQNQRRATAKFTPTSTKKPLPALSIHGRRLDPDHVLPRNFLASQSDALVSPTPAHRRAPLESTPLTARHHRARMAHKKPRHPAALPLSPLPPSSPPASDEDDHLVPVKLATHLHTEVATGSGAENEDEDDKENNVVQTQTEVVLEDEARVGALEDDPFGILQVERQLKVQRETQARCTAPLPSKNKGKGVARAPFDELHVDPFGSSPTARRRAPTPYHPSDDLRQSDGLPPSDNFEDMYLDPEEHLGKDNANTSLGKLELVKEMEAEEDEGEGEAREDEPVVHDGSPPATRDPLRTPRPHHVADIQPLPSPFSPVEGTSGERDLVGTPPSSPSPVKRGAFVLPLLSTVKKGPWSVRAKGFPTPFTGASASVRAKSSSVAKENHSASESTLAPSTPLLDRLPKKPTKRRTAVASSAPKTTKSRKAAAKSKGKQREEVVEREEVFSGTGEEPMGTVDTLTITRKRKATSKAKSPRKRLKVEVVVPPPPHTRRKTTKPTSSTSHAKAKGTGAAAPRRAKQEDEDSDDAQARQARIEYFKKLDSYNLAKENVYVI